jgi:hypothetical protein
MLNSSGGLQNSREVHKFELFLNHVVVLSNTAKPL